ADGAARGSEEPRQGVFVVAGDDRRDAALALVTELRRAGIPADLDLAGRASKGQMKQADRIGAHYALILSEEAKATLRDMDSGEERQVDPATLVETLSSP
ncbi:MAG: His/Gly/Thr/Pro-type tRNA ligase C-terminal domain-containing protein, partial [Solirubrobacterales bacterium]